MITSSAIDRIAGSNGGDDAGDDSPGLSAANDVDALAVQRDDAFLVTVDRTHSHFVPKIFKAQNRPFGYS